MKHSTTEQLHQYKIVASFSHSLQFDHLRSICFKLKRIQQLVRDTPHALLEYLYCETPKGSVGFHSQQLERMAK